MSDLLYKFPPVENFTILLFWWYFESFEIQNRLPSLEVIINFEMKCNEQTAAASSSVSQLNDDLATRKISNVF